MPKRRRKAKAARGEPTADDLAALDATDWAAVKAEVDALRSRLNSMGAVNLVAIEEYAVSSSSVTIFCRARSSDLDGGEGRTRQGDR